MSHHLKSERKTMKNKLAGAVSKKPIPVKIVNDTPKTSYSEEDKKWRAQDDLRALQRAEEIRADKSRMSAVKSCVSEQLKTLKKIK